MITIRVVTRQIVLLKRQRRGQSDDHAPRGFAGLVPAAALAVAVGVILRFVAPSPLWLDEALSVHIATGDVGLADALRRDGHPGLYYLLLGWWADLVGESDGATRALSGIFGILTLPVLWMAARRHGRDVATATLVLAASSPYLIRYATEVRMYALLVLVIAAGWLALETAWANPRPVPLLGVAATTAAALHTHYWSLYAIAAAGLIVVWAGRENTSRPVAIRILTAMGLSGLTFVPWLPVLTDQLRDTGTPWADRARPTEVFIETLQDSAATTDSRARHSVSSSRCLPWWGSSQSEPHVTECFNCAAALRHRFACRLRLLYSASGSVPPLRSQPPGRLRPATPPSPSRSSSCSPGEVLPCSTAERNSSCCAWSSCLVSPSASMRHAAHEARASRWPPPSMPGQTRLTS